MAVNPLELIKQHRVIAAGTLLALGGGTVGLVGSVTNHTYPIPPGSCISRTIRNTTPEADRDTIVLLNGMLLVQTDTGAFARGELIHGEVPSGADGVVISFGSPGGSTEAWEATTSPMVEADASGKFAAKVAFGNGLVEFGVSYVAHEGSPLCSATPTDITFTHLSMPQYFDASGTLPWPNFVSAGINVLGF